ncbi:MAG TPA: DinB family protein [Gemmatimonadales bacterium]|nr:DinB family protein [Gemmatimonadales bacterium]
MPKIGESYTAARAQLLSHRPPPGARATELRLLDAWRTNNRVTIYLLERLTPKLWSASLPGSPLRTVGMTASHIHNVRCRWVRTLGGESGVAVPAMVEARRATRRQVVSALRQSSRGILALLRTGQEHGGSIPPSAAYTWRNLPLDVEHVLCYFVAHEAQHRGQIVLAARALGARLPAEVTDGLWQWNRRSVEGKASR